MGEHKILVKFDGEEVAPAFVVESVQTGDADKCTIQGIPALWPLTQSDPIFPPLPPTGEVKPAIGANEECSLKVDAKQAGTGSLTAKLTRVQSKSETSETTTERVEKTPTGGTRVIKETRRETKTQTQRETHENIDCKVVANKDGTYSVKYRVKEPGQYTLELKFGGKPVPNGVFNFSVN